MPLHLAQAARGKGEEPYIIRLKGQCDCLFEGFESVCLPVGKVGAVIASLRQAKCDKLALVGQFKRPAFTDISLDKSALTLMGRMMLTGDDAALRIVAAYFENRTSQLSQTLNICLSKYCLCFTALKGNLAQVRVTQQNMRGQSWTT